MHNTPQKQRDREQEFDVRVLLADALRHLAQLITDESIDLEDVKTSLGDITKQYTEMIDNIDVLDIDDYPL